MKRTSASLEVFRMTLYIAVPAVTAYYICSPEFMSKFIKKRRYVQYPPEADFPDLRNAEELQEILSKHKKPKDKEVNDNVKAPTSTSWRTWLKFW